MPSTNAGRLKSVALAMTRLPHFKRRSGGVSEQDVLGADLIPALPGAAPRAVAPMAPPDDVFNPVCGEVPQMVERQQPATHALRLPLEKIAGTTVTVST